MGFLERTSVGEVSIGVNVYMLSVMCNFMFIVSVFQIERIHSQTYFTLEWWSNDSALWQEGEDQKLMKYS